MAICQKPEAAKPPLEDLTSPHASQLPGLYGLMPEDRRPWKGLATPFVKQLPGTYSLKPEDKRPNSPFPGIYCTKPEERRPWEYLASPPNSHLPGIYGIKPEDRGSMDLSRPNAKSSSGLALVSQKPEERSPYLSLARQTPGMPAIGQKKEARVEPSDYQTAGWPEGGPVIFKDFAR